MKNLDFNEEPPWEHVWDNTSLSTSELRLLLFALLDRLELEVHIRRYGDSGRDPEFFLERYQHGN